MKYAVMGEQDIETAAEFYRNYCNGSEGACWTAEKARKRIRQMVTIEDSYCLTQRDDEGHLTGVVIGYFKEYDDLTAYVLEEIVIGAAYQNRGYGRQFLAEIERRALERGAEMMELISVNDAHHARFYGGFGMYEASNLKVMGKHYGPEGNGPRA